MRIVESRHRSGRKARPGTGVLFLAMLLVSGAVAGPEWGCRQFLSRSIMSRLVERPKCERMVLAGAEASGTVIDGRGGWINGGRFTEILICSRRGENGAWDRPADIVIENGRLRGSLRILGMGRNGEAREVRNSSRREGHTARAQAAAPTRIVLRNLEIEAAGLIPLYLAPGATEVTIEDCTIRGWTSSVALYLDAESARNVIRNNTFDVRVSREIIAVDGSADNEIENNRFESVALGGIYLYRNCGEGGTVRHQAPQGNVIAGNRFDLRSLAWRAVGIWLGSRNGRRTYCHADDGFPFGSSVDNRDFAHDNLVSGNRFEPAAGARAIRDDGEGNRIEFRTLLGSRT